jgi:hypothetical protein
LKPDNDYENQLAAMDWSRVVFLFIAMMVIWPKAVTGHRKYEGILLICQMRFPMSKILASMKMNGSITNSSRPTNARLCFSVRQRFFISTAQNSICSKVDNKSSILLGLQYDAKKGVRMDYKPMSQKKEKTLTLIISSTGRPKTQAMLFLLFPPPSSFLFL